MAGENRRVGKKRKKMVGEKKDPAQKRTKRELKSQSDFFTRS